MIDEKLLYSGPDEDDDDGEPLPDEPDPDSIGEDDEPGN